MWVIGIIVTRFRKTYQNISKLAVAGSFYHGREMEQW